jgi:hypothetical protein
MLRAFAFCQIKVLDPSLTSDEKRFAQIQRVAGTEKLWKDLDGQTLQFDSPERPAALCCMAHMRRAVVEAEARKWISPVGWLGMPLALCKNLDQ